MDLIVRIVSLNVNSLVDYRRRFLLDNFISHNPAHIYFLQETKGPLHGFSHSSFSTFSSRNRNGCGNAALLIHTGIRVRNVYRFSGSIDAVFADIFVNDCGFAVGSVYVQVHPQCNNIGVLEQFLGTRDQFLVDGDLNARHQSFGDFSDNFIGYLLD